MESRVYPDFLTASLGKRAAAFIIDLILISSISGFFTSMALSLGVKSSEEFLSTFYLIKLAIFLGYFTITTLVTNGQSLGKMIFGIKIVKEDGEDLSPLDIITREFFVNFILHKFQIFYMAPIFISRNRALGDLAIDTVIIDLIKLEEYENYKLYDNLYKETEFI